MTPFIISFFTNDWEYPDHAVRLRRECQDLGIESHIVEIESTGSYRGNCSKKPQFILDSLQRFQRPLLWLDVDASILKYPRELISDEILRYDIAAIRKKPNLDHWYVGSMWFNYTPVTVEFMKQWCQRVGTFVDDGAFQSVYVDHKHALRLMELDPSMHTVMIRGQPAISPETCFAHRISRGQSKQEEKKASKKISQAKKHAIIQ